MAKYKARIERTGAFRTEWEKNKTIVLRTQTICGICGQPVDKTIKAPDPMSPTVDHIIPVSKGGHPSDLQNLQLAHRWCNRQKSNKITPTMDKRKLEEGKEVNNDDLPLSFDWNLSKAK